jgi:hypothetical protein
VRCTQAERGRHPHQERRPASTRLPAADVADAGVAQVDHAVLGEAADKPGDFQDAALRCVVGVPDDRSLSYVVSLSLSGRRPRSWLTMLKTSGRLRI